MKKRTPSSRTQGLKRCAEERRKETEEQVSRVIDQMKREGRKISFSSVAERAGVSRTTLYSHERLAERIRGLAAFSEGGQAVKERVPVGKNGFSDRIKILREQVKKLESDKEKLIVQLAGHYELGKENERLRRQLEKAYGKVIQEEERDDNG